MIRAFTRPQILLCLLTSILVWSNNTYGESPLKFNIGVALSLSGDCADVGTDSLKGLQLAVEEINR